VPQSNTTPTVTLVKTIVYIIAWVMNLINSLSAISVYVGGCEFMYAASTYEDQATLTATRTLMNIIK